MTEISFHFNVVDRSAYACRFLANASRAGSRVVVAGPAAVLAALDRLLWTFEPLAFVAHRLLREGERMTPRLARTPIWLMEDVSSAQHAPLLLNLWDAPPAGFESFERLLEIVSTGEADRAAARERWKHYAARGYPIQRREVGTGAAA